MRHLPTATVLAIILAAFPPRLRADLGAGEAAMPSTESRAAGVWSRFAGLAEELEAEKLEIRDELIAANLGYLAAFGKALAEARGLAPDDPVRPLAWARVEYLLETSFRLLESTGEYEAFLAATGGLRQPPAPEMETPPPPGQGGGESSIPGSGLVFSDASGRRLLPALVAGEWILVDAETSRPASADQDISAVPAAPPLEDGGGDFIPALGRSAWLRALALERMGRVEEAGAEAAGLGLIRDWLILGPLDRDADISFSGPQNILGAPAPDGSPPVFNGLSGPVSWRPFKSADPLGRLWPGAMFRARGNKVGCALALVHSPVDVGAVLHFGSGSPASVGVNNGSGRREHFGGSPDPDREAIDVWLRKGWNAIFVRMESSPGEWGIAARLTDPRGAALPVGIAGPEPGNLAAILAEAAKAVENSVLDVHYRPPERAGADSVSVLIDRVLEHSDDARAAFYLATFLMARRTMDGAHRFDRELILQWAVKASDGDPFFALTAARCVDSGLDGPDREAIDVWLRKGWNAIFVRMESSPGEWGIAAR
ncbi:MAG: hypothetical protein LBU23_13625, partial [Planctomycetota bacterium]|nr:hypothetical protein [Planctomycetota bacterium]